MGDIADLHLSSPTWIKRRVDRFEFVGLTTIQHSITLTLDLATLARGRAPGAAVRLPVGLFDRERAPTSVLDAAGAVVAHLPTDDANQLFKDAIGTRLRARGVAVGELDVIQRHRADRCELLTTGGVVDGYADLASEKWGCPSVGALLARLVAANCDQAAVHDIARLLFDWQNCDPLVIDARPDEPAFGTLSVSFDEDLTPWQTPWDRRRAALTRTGHHRADAPLRDRTLRSRTSRGGPFNEDLDKLAPVGVRGRLARTDRPRWRNRGRRGFLPLVWHVVWEQWAVVGVERHIEVVVPPELSVVRLRSLRPAAGAAVAPPAEVASQVGLRARLTLVPKLPAKGERREAPELMSLLLCRRDPQSWSAGAFVALLAGVLLVAAVWLVGERLDDKLDPAVTLILLGPAFTAGLLSSRATSDIADELLVGLRRLLASVAVLTVLAAAAMVAGDGRASHVFVSIFGALLVGCGCLLGVGAFRSGRLQDESRERERATDMNDLAHRLQARAKRQPTPAPDRFVVSGEGERVPWGWLAPASGPPPLDLDDHEEDRRYWRPVQEVLADEVEPEQPIIDLAREVAKGRR